MKISKLLAAAALAAASHGAMATETFATGSGECDYYNTCNNTNTSILAFHGAGSWQANQFHNWFAFFAPTTPVSSASISIFSSHLNNVNRASTDIFYLHGTTAFSFTGLVNGAIFGQVNTKDTNFNMGNTDRWVDIQLNVDGLNYINQHLGQQIIFGGIVTSKTGGFGSEDVFGHTTGTANGQADAKLITTPVPEPETYAMLLAGLGVMGAVARRRQGKQA